MSIYYVDIDGVLCNNTYGDYYRAKPIKENIKKINKLFEARNEIILWTARGTKLIERRQEIIKLTKEQLKEWDVKFTRLEFEKPYYDFIIEDRAVNIDDI